MPPPAELVWLVAKPMPALLLAGLVRRREHGTYARRLAVGLVLSAVGDLCMELRGGFLAGLGVFLLAHLAYAAAFLAEGRRPGLLRALPFLAFAGGAFAVLRPGLGGLVAPVALYVTAIAVMMWRAACCLGEPGRPGVARVAALGGAILFAASDLLIGLDRFRAPIPHGRVAILALYWAGQAGIALSVLLAARLEGRRAAAAR